MFMTFMTEMAVVNRIVEEIWDCFEQDGSNIITMIENTDCTTREAASNRIFQN